MVALHSTMFLLILQIAANIIGEHIVFTFHNVSINTRSSFSILSLVPLFTFHNVSINTTFWLTHSESMSVFTFHNVSINTGSAVKRIGLLIGFTFHNVSINTETREAIQGVNYNTLHSTMFLLIRKRHRKDHEQGHDFTFHNVSINTEYRDEIMDGIALYIPQCFY